MRISLVSGFRAGSLLLEILVVIGVFAIISPLVAQIVVSGFNTSKWSIENSAALNLADETIRAVENISFEKWQNIYKLDKSAAGHYYPTVSGTAWSVANGEETLAVDGRSYGRYFTVADVCRDDVTDKIVSVLPCSAGSTADPSTQKISVVVSWTDNSLVKEAYLTRWRNKLCHQTNWGFVSSGAEACPSNAYGSASDINPAAVPGSLILLAN